MTSPAASMMHASIPLANSSQDGNDEDLMRCWRHQGCSGCLEEPNCNWCPFSWTCVPNHAKIPFLAPAFDDMVCPHPQETWEVRTNPFGCHASTTTILTSVITVACTITLVNLTVVMVWACNRLIHLAKKNPDWWRRVFVSPTVTASRTNNISGRGIAWQQGWDPERGAHDENDNSDENQPLLSAA